MVTGEFDEEILEDLIKQGYTGENLLNEFKKMRAKVPAALEKMFEDVIAQSNGEYYPMEEVFDSGDEINVQ